MKAFMHVAMLIAAAAVLAPVAFADDSSSAYGLPRAMPSDYYTAAATEIEARHGIPRAMPWHYEAAGVPVGQRSGVPRAMPSDYVAAGVTEFTKPQPVAADVDAPTLRWGDVAVGVAIGFALAGLLAAAALVVARSRRHAAS